MSGAGKRLNPFQHARLRPDTYIGSKKTTIQEVLVCVTEDVENNEDEETEEAGNEKKATLELRSIPYNSGLVQPFIELKSNAIDNKWRSEDVKIKMTSIDFECDDDPDSAWYGWVTVANDGYPIPGHKETYEYEDHRTGKVISEDLFPAETFFGDMMAGTNFENDESRKTSGRNGMGAKLAVIFSDHTIVNHSNVDDGIEFTQEFTEAGKTRTTPVITKYTGKTNFTKVSMLPSYAYFGYSGLDADLISVFKCHAYEAAMITGMNVTFNGEKLVVRSLEKFVRMIYPDTKENCMMSFVAPTGDECVLVERSTSEFDQLENVKHHSWINGVDTREGGTHVTAWRDSIFPTIVKTFNARKKSKDKATLPKASAKDIYPYFHMFIRCEAYNTAFKTQAKQELVEPSPYLLFDPEDAAQKKAFAETIKEKLPKIMKWNFVALLEEKLEAKGDSKLAKAEGKKRINIPKLKDANYAGTKRANDCWLLITEGDSAKAFGIRYISAIENGTDFYGVIPVRGKGINPMKATRRALMANEEYKSVRDAIGFHTEAHYETPAGLRYGGILFMSDQDTDGLHIDGLLQCTIYVACPSLFYLAQAGQFKIGSINTGVGIISKGPKVLDIKYSVRDLDFWYEEQAVNPTKGVTSRYLKGLSSHLPGDEMLYAGNEKINDYFLDGEEAYYMQLGYGKGSADARKAWITAGMPKSADEIVLADEVPFRYEGKMSLSEYVRDQLVIYHGMTLERALPSLLDGKKDSTRKVMYGILSTPKAKNGVVGLDKLCGIIGEMTSYHHGPTSMIGAAIGMAQGFVGSNNVPLCKNHGEFGTREEGGKDHGAPRYIATGLEEIALKIYHPMDEPLYTMGTERDTEGKIVEVGYTGYIGVIPELMANGCIGIAGGYSTGIPCYNPDDLVRWAKAWIAAGGNKPDLPWLTPWYRGFKGTIELMRNVGTKQKPQYEVVDPYSNERPTAWRSKGILLEGEKGWWSIEELPIGLWTKTMEGYLKYMEDGVPPEKSKKKKSDTTYITDLRWRGSANTVGWDFKPTKEFTPDIEIAGNFKILQKIHSLNNMHVLNDVGYPVKYATAEDMYHDFCKARMRFYERRRAYWIGQWGKELHKENSKYLFIRAVSPQLDGTLNLYRADAEVYADMDEMGLYRDEDAKGAGLDENGEMVGGFGYLLSMQMRSMTPKRLAEIQKEADKIQVKIDDYEGATPADLWIRDLDDFQTAWVKFQTTRVEEYTKKK